MLKKRSKLTWSRVKALLGALKDVPLLDLVHDLYELSEDNRDFIHAKLTRDASSFRPYLEAVESALYPDVYENGRIPLGDARRAIAKYRKATGDAEGTLELMLRYVECGTAFSAEYGDMDAAFYSSPESMFDEILKVIGSLPPGDHEARIKRLAQVAEQAGAVGWGYQDHITEALHRAFPQHADRYPEPDA